MKRGTGMCKDGGGGGIWVVLVYGLGCLTLVSFVKSTLSVYDSVVQGVRFSCPSVYNEEVNWPPR